MNPDITVVSVGSGDPELMNIRTMEAMKNARSLILRTSRHPVTDWLERNRIAYSSLDELYDIADDFDDLDLRIADSLLQRASDSPVVYAVPDASSDAALRALLRKTENNGTVKIIPGVGSGDLYLSASLAFLPESAVTILPASELLNKGYFDPNLSMLVTELDNPLLAGQVKILLSDLLDDEYEIIFMNGAEAHLRIPLYELDRMKGIDHRSAVLVPGSDFRVRNRFVLRDLMSIMEMLRSPQGCPWDRAQTHLSLRQYLVEEAWECVAAIGQEDMDHLSEELGDLLLQIVFHASIGKDFDEFTLSDVLSAICVKMIRRHPHVFAGQTCDDADSVRSVWEQIKQNETGHTGIIESLEDVSPGLPSLKYASKALKKLKRMKAFHRSPDDIASDIQAVAGKIAGSQDAPEEDDLGRLLFLCTELCSHYDLDGELLLRQAADRLKRILPCAEKQIINDGKSLESLTFDELGVYLKHVEGEIE